jgi:hypothetical protein
MIRHNEGDPFANSDNAYRAHGYMYLIDNRVAVNIAISNGEGSVFVFNLC